MNTLSFTPMPPTSTERNDKYMPAYYNEDTKKWYCKFYYKDWQGNRKQKKKSGFERKKDALEWERSFRDKLAGSPDMPFSSMVELYLADKKKQVKASTYNNQKQLINCWILPYFKDTPINNIKPVDIRQWQGKLKDSPSQRGGKLSPTYTRAIHGVLSAIFNFAVRFYKLPSNPCYVAGNILGSPKKNLDFWTKEEFDRFISSFDKSDPYYVVFLTLYYTGMRIGELQALTFTDLDLENGIMHITKTYYFVHGKGTIGTPKTPESIRDILIPNFLCQILKKHEQRYYKPLPETRLFQVPYHTIRRRLKKHAQIADVPEIRVHDLRHSHASLLINLGFSVLMISERLGHKDPSVTLRIYAHLFPSKQSELMVCLDKLFQESETK